MTALPARERVEDRSPEELAERLGIVVVTRNRREQLCSTLDRLQALEAPYPVVIVDNASTDGTTGALLNRPKPVDLIRLPRNLGAVARNHGVCRLEREIIAFADDDSWWELGALRRAIELFDRHPNLGLIMARVLVGLEQRLDPCCELMSRSPLPRRSDLPGAPILGFLACGAVVRRSAFLENGGFDERFGSGGEENLVAMDLAERGWDLAYVPEIVCHHYPSTSRDHADRHIQGVTVKIWEAWMRRSLRHALAITARYLRQTRTDPLTRAGVIHALRGMPATLRRRKPVSPEIEAQLRLLEQQRGDG